MTRNIALAVLAMTAVFSAEAWANKTSVELSGPSSVAEGTEVTITVTVRHRGNSALHYTNWVWVKADGVEIARWEFKSSSRPEGETFTREVKYTVTKPVDITAQGNCNLHGSGGPASLKIEVQKNNL